MKLSHTASARLIGLADRAARSESQMGLTFAGSIHRLGRRVGPLPLIVWSPQSSGSTAVHRALQESLDRPVLHLHHIEPSARGHRESVRAARGGSGAPRREEREADWLEHYLGAGQDTPLDIVTVVRDPVARLVSHWFQFAHSWGELPDPGADAPAAVATAIEDFELLELALEWFLREVDAYADVELGAMEFDVSEGFGEIRSRRARVLVLRTAALDRIGPTALSEFVGAKVELNPETNRAGGKPYANLYAQFLDAGVLPAVLVDRLLDQPAVRVTHSEASLREIRQRWVRSNPVSDGR